MKSFSYLCISLVFLINSYTSNAMDLDSPLISDSEVKQLAEIIRRESALESDSKVKQLAEIIRKSHVLQVEEAFPKYLTQLRPNQLQYIKRIAKNTQTQAYKKSDVYSLVSMYSFTIAFWSGIFGSLNHLIRNSIRDSGLGLSEGYEKLILEMLIDLKNYIFTTNDTIDTVACKITTCTYKTLYSLGGISLTCGLVALPFAYKWYRKYDNSCKIWKIINRENP